MRDSDNYTATQSKKKDQRFSAKKLIF